MKGATRDREGPLQVVDPVSIHAPMKGATPVLQLDHVPAELVSIHAPMKGATRLGFGPMLPASKFQSTRP